MSLLKLVIGLVILGCIVVIVQEIRKQKREEDKDAKVAADLREELDEVNDQLYRADVEETVIDAKTELKSRREELDKKTADLEATPKKQKKAAKK